MVRADVRLCDHTTLGVGGIARRFERVDGIESLTDALSRARREKLPVLVLGGGSNMLVSDDGWDGLVIRQEASDVTFRSSGPKMLVRASAGVCWDRLVAETVSRDLAGIECLSGIPGDVGAAPIQNIGAYGQELRDVLVAVHVVDRKSLSRRRFTASECGFGYRTSRFKTIWRDRYVVTGIELALLPGGAPTLTYGQLSERFDDRPTLAAVREAVLEVRAAKSMVLDPNDPNRRSAGSFFTNPIVGPNTRDRAVAQLAEAGVDVDRMPTYREPGARFKLSAAWLIERCGFERGYGTGPAGLSTNHCLAVINRGGATAKDLIALAGEIRRTVRERTSITLTPEPSFIGFRKDVDRLLG